MDSIERIRMTLAHEEPDRIPFDLGGTLVTSIHIQAYRHLREALGLSNDNVSLAQVFGQVAHVDEDVLSILEADAEPILPNNPSTYTLEVTREGNCYKFYDEWGIGCFMPVDGGKYFDMREFPLADVDTTSGLARYRWPDPRDEARYAGMTQIAQTIVKERKRASAISSICAGILEMPLFLKGFENFYCDMLTNRTFAEAIMDRIVEIKQAYWTKALATVGENVLVVCENDDFAGQQGSILSPDLYRSVIKPCQKILFDHIRKEAKVPVYIFLHSCGAVYEFIPDFIEVGVDILNPVQVNAVGMDTRKLKKEFGNDLTFWGGGVDTQRILPFGTPQEVKDEVKRRIDDLAPGGGFVFNTVHTIQSDVPPENILAMVDALREYGQY